MMNARTIVSLTPGNSASACRSRCAGTSRISLSSAAPRTVTSAAVPISIATSPIKSRGPAGRQNLLLAVARLEGLERAAQDHRQRHIALARSEDQLAPPHNAPRPQRLEHGQLPVIELGKRHALGVPVKLFVLVHFGHNQP